MKYESQDDTPVATAQAMGLSPDYKENKSKRVEISVRELRQAILLAESAANEALSKIRDLESRRDHFAREVGGVQRMLDDMMRLHAERTAHVRALEALLS